MYIGAYVVIVVLTTLLVIMNVQAVIQRFLRDRNAVRLYSYMATLLVMGFLIFGATSAIIQQVIDSENFMRMDESGPIRYYKR